jgi:hypothetical protein
MTEILTPTPEEIRSLAGHDDTEPTGLDINTFATEVSFPVFEEWITRRGIVLKIYEKFAQIHPTGYEEIYQAMLEETARELKIPEEGLQQVKQRRRK